MRRIMVRTLVLVAVSSLCACSPSKSLSRSRAAELINRSASFKPQPGKIPLTDEEVKRGVSAGYWEIRHAISFGDLLYTTPKGDQLFAGFEPQIQGSILNLRQDVSLYVVDVTGIVDNATPDPSISEKVVEFTYNYKFGNVPPEVRALFKDHPSHPASRVFRLYDDGWRVQ